MNTDNQPDWNEMAEKFDLWTPHIRPVGETLIKALAAKTGEHILDVASGTGEPALTLAKQFNDEITISGTDAAEGMVRVANQKATAAGLKQLHFQAMPAEALDFPDAHFDRVMSRFGVMLFADPLKGLRQMHRVLKPGGRIAIAIWSEAEHMPTLHWSYLAFKERLSAELLPPCSKVTSLGKPGIIDDLFQQAGFSDFTVQKCKFNYDFASFDDYWATIKQSDFLKEQFTAIDSADEKNLIVEEIRQMANQYISDIDGRFVVPHQYLLIHGNR